MPAPIPALALVPRPLEVFNGPEELCIEDEDDELCVKDEDDELCIKDEDDELCVIVAGNYIFISITIAYSLTLGLPHTYCCSREKFIDLPDVYTID